MHAASCSRAGAASALELPPLDDHYADDVARRAAPPRARPVRATPAGAGRRRARPCALPRGRRRARRGGAGRRRGARAAARRALAPGDVAVVFRDPGAYASLRGAGLRRLRHPVLDRPLVPLGAHRRSAAACSRCCAAPPRTGPPTTCSPTCARPGCSTQPGAGRPAGGRRCARPGRQLAAEAPRAVGARALDRSRSSTGWRGARRRRRFVDELERALERAVRRPLPPRTAAVLRRPGARRRARVRAARDGARRAARAASSATRAPGSTAGACTTCCAQLRVHVGENPQPDRVQVAPPEAIRARRFEAVFVLRAPGGRVPARGSPPEPFLSDDDRRAIATASGLVLPLREDRLDRERYLFYVCASRAERAAGAQLALRATRRAAPQPGRSSSRTCATCSPARRAVARARWPTSPGARSDAPTAAEWERALRGAPARAGEAPARPARRVRGAARASSASRDAVSASALENFADCPVKWLVENVLRPEALEPDPEPMVRGRYAHAVLRAHLRAAARARPAPAASRRRTSREAERILLRGAARRSSRAFRLSPKQTRVRAARAPARVRPAALPAPRGRARRRVRARAPRAALRHAGEAGARSSSTAGVQRRAAGSTAWTPATASRWCVDYKSGKRVDCYQVGALGGRRTASRPRSTCSRCGSCSGCEPAGGVYVPLGGKDRRPRGHARARSVERARQRLRRATTSCRAEEFAREARLGARADRARPAGAHAQGRRCAPVPRRCAWNGGCSYPSICRSER